MLNRYSADGGCALLHIRRSRIIYRRVLRHNTFISIAYRLNYSEDFNVFNLSKNEQEKNENETITCNTMANPMKIKNFVIFQSIEITLYRLIFNRL